MVNANEICSAVLLQAIPTCTIIASMIIFILQNMNTLYVKNKNIALLWRHVKLCIGLVAKLGVLLNTGTTEGREETEVKIGRHYLVHGRHFAHSQQPPSTGYRSKVNCNFPFRGSKLLNVASKPHDWKSTWSQMRRLRAKFSFSRVSAGNWFCLDSHKKIVSCLLCTNAILCFVLHGDCRKIWYNCVPISLASRKGFKKT